MVKGYKEIWVFSLIPAAIIAGVITVLNPGQQPLIGLSAAFLLGWLSSTLMATACLKLGCTRAIYRLTAISFALRFLIGIILFIALPIYGHDEAPPRAGYLYLDAYQRDMDAWRLAESGESLAIAFTDQFHTDQYGGLLSLSGMVYRYLSPDSHRPLLILILTAFFTSVGLPFFWKAVSQRWGDRTATVSAWLYALYPESIILGASQMREPILIGLSAVAFWSVTTWRGNKPRATAALICSVLGLAFISIKAGASLALVLGIWFWIENLLPVVRRPWNLLGSLLIGAVILISAYFSWDWLVDSAKWDLYLMEASSGRIQFELEKVGGRFRTPFIVGYGLAQPVLPAAIIYPGIAITRAVAIFRSVGWYLLAPLLTAGFILVCTGQKKEDRRVLLFLFIAVIAWLILSSARAGGDQWDNPRYRSIFMVWMALLGGWAWVETGRRRSPWLRRLILLEAIYVGYFMQWYISRYLGWVKRLPFWRMIQILAIYTVVIIAGGFLFDLVYNKVRKTKE